MAEDCSRVEIIEEDGEPRIDEDGNPLPHLEFPVNAGFGRGSYMCSIQENGMMTIPDGLVRELNIEVGDDLVWTLDEDEGTLYVKVSRRPWEAPDWLDIEE